MAFASFKCSLLHFVVLYLCVLLLLDSCYCFYPKLLINISNSESDSDWLPAVATWYGSPTGAGSNGGACGYGASVDQPPFSAMVSAGGASLFKAGKGCGACYQVRCTSDADKACSENSVSVVITDNCPGGPCTSDPVHFDLSGTAFGAMATSGEADQLRNAGVLKIQYRKADCNYPGKTVTFHVDSGSNSNYFATLIEYEDGDGELTAIELKQALDSDTWLSMQQSWGAVWKLDSPSTLRAPFSLRLTALGPANPLVATAVIPAGWQPGQTYRSLVNFKP